MISLTRIRFCILAILLACTSPALCSSAGEDSTDTELDRLAALMMRYYSFAWSAPSSDVLVIDIEKETGAAQVLMLLAGSKQLHFAKVYIWWPKLGADDVKNLEILEKAVFTVLKESKYGTSYKRGSPDYTAFVTLLRLKGLRDYKRYLRLFEAQYDGAYQSKEDSLGALIKIQGIAFQDTRYNSMVLDRIEALYPSLPKPYGVYLEYFDDPRSWQWWE